MTQENFGGGYIEISAKDNELYADLKKTERKLEKELKDMGKKGGDEYTDALHLSVKTGLIKVRRELKKLEKKLTTEVEVEVKNEKAKASLKAMARKRTMSLWVRLRKNKAAIEIKKMISSLSGFKIMSGWITSFKGMIQNLPNMALSLATIGSAIGALVPPIGSALTSIGPLATSLAAIGPLALAAVPGIIGMVTAMQILTISFKDLDKSAAPAAKKFNAVLTSLKPKLKELKTGIQQNFFSGGFTKAFETATKKLFPDFAKGVKLVATSLSDTLGAGISGLTSAMSGGGMLTMFKNISKMFENAAGGAKAFGAAIGKIAVKASPALATLGTEFTKLGEKFGKWVEDSDIEKMVNDAITATKQLFFAVGQAWSIVKGLFSSMDTGKSTGLESMGAALATIAEIVNGEQFQTTMKTIFQGMNEGATELARSLGPIGDNFSALAPTLSEIFSTLGSTAGSAIKGISDALAAPGAQEGLLKAVAGIQQLVENIDWDAVGAAIGAIGTSIGNIAPKVADFINALLPYVPGIMSFVDGLVNILGLLPPELILATGGALKFSGTLGKLGGPLSKIGGFIGKVVFSPRQLATFARLGGLAPKIIFLSRAMIQFSSASKIATMAIRGIGFAIKFMMGPWGLVIAGLALLVAGLIYAYQHSETFRNIVNGALEQVGRMFRWLWNAAVQPAVQGITMGISWIVRSIAGMLRAFGTLPGQEWATGAADAMDSFADSVDSAAGSILKIPDPKVDTHDSKKQVKDLDKQIKGLRGKVVEARAKGDTKAVKNLQEEIKKLHDKQIELRVQTKMDAKSKKLSAQFGWGYANGGITDFTRFATGGIAQAFAKGGLLKSFAGGAENHIAQIARPGAMRLWAEPETGGEAYIPLSASKRNRSLAIWEETGRRLGALGPSLQDSVRKFGQTNANDRGVSTTEYNFGGLSINPTAKEARVIEEYVALAKRKARAAGANGRAVMT